MKKYKVGGLYVSAEIIAGDEPWGNGQWDDPYGDYVEAESPEEAIEQVMDWLVEETSSEAEIAEINEAGDMVIYRDEEGKIISGIALFEATEMPCRVTYKWEKGGEWSSYFTVDTEEEARQDVEEYKPYAYRIIDITGDIVDENLGL